MDSTATLSEMQVNARELSPSDLREPPGWEPDNVEAIKQFVACLFEPSDIVEVRCFGTNKPTKQSWFTADDLSAQADAMEVLNAQGYNVYIGANPRKQRGGAKASDVALARCLFVDFDHLGDDPAVRLMLARQHSDAAGLPRPTLILDSGHGIHVYWRLSEPMTDLAAWTGLQKRLIAVLDSDKSIHDSPRIMRLAGFQNCKGEPWQPCKIIEANPTRRYALAQIEALLPSGNGRPSPVERARLYVAAIPGEVAKNRNNTAYKVGCKLRDFALTEAEGFPILCEWNRRNSPPLDDAELHSVYQDAQKYAKGQPGSKLNEDNQGDGNDGDNGVADPVTDDQQRQRLVARVQKLLRCNRFRGVVQYGRVDASYQMIFADRKGGEVCVPFKSTTEIHSRKSVANRLWETIDFELTIKPENWFKVLRLLRKLMTVVEGQDEQQTHDDRIRDYIDSRNVKASAKPQDAALVVAGEAKGNDGTLAVKKDESFWGNDGKLYLKLPDLQQWLCQQSTPIKPKDLTTALARLGFEAKTIAGYKTIAGENTKERIQGRYWIRVGRP